MLSSEFSLTYFLFYVVLLTWFTWLVDGKSTAGSLNFVPCLIPSVFVDPVLVADDHNFLFIKSISYK